MKDYDRYVIWLDYFDSELKREGGRRVPLSAATKAPRLEELEEACRKLNLQPTAERAAYPSSSPKQSGYVSVRKVKPKSAMILKIARELSVDRGMEQKKQAQQPRKK
ncbi:MAG: signal recognition particle protein Srp19 [Nitrososphaerota archaeon]|nr:signal recognition particle protein Srp19 [Nitrososphaerota archaeon]